MGSKYNKFIDVLGYEGLYQINSKGVIKSLERSHPHSSGSVMIRKESIMKASPNGKGYPTVHLSKNRKYKFHTVHRLLMLSFFGEVEGKPYVNHIDGNKENYLITNLEWVSASENCKHAHDTGLQPSKKGEGNGRAKLTNKRVILIREMSSYCDLSFSVRWLARCFKVSPTTVRGIIKRDKWAHI